MVITTDVPIRQAIDEHLMLRSAANADDVRRVAEFDGLIHGREVTATTLDLFTRHPHTCLDDLLFVENVSSGDVVSSLCLIPWRITYENTHITAGEMGIVGTLEPYRRRGLIRAQVEVFKRRLNERGCVLSNIEGIWYYYRQFGYEYAMPLDGGLIITRRNVPARAGATDGHAAPDNAAGAFTFRQADPSDVVSLAALYDAAAGDIAIHTERDEATWRYLLERNTQSATDSETWVVLDEHGQMAGYFRLPEHHFGDELTVNEVSRFTFDAAWAVLGQVTALAEARATPGVRLCLPPQCDLMRVARSFGAHDMGMYAWQIMVPDPSAFLRAVAPALEMRVSRSLFSGLTRDLTVSFFRRCVCLRFVNGCLMEVIDLDGVDRGDVRIPLNAFIPLALGYRTFDEQHAHFPDMGASPECRLLVDILFPRCQSFLYPNY